MDFPRFINDPGDKHFGQEGDHAGTADPSWGDVADDAVGRLIPLGVDPDFLDGSRRGPHPVPHSRALKGWPGRTGAGQQPIGVA